MHTMKEPYLAAWPMHAQISSTSLSVKVGNNGRVITLLANETLRARPFVWKFLKAENPGKKG